MWIQVTQVIPNGHQWVDVNTDLIETIRENNGGLSLHFASGRIVEITEDRAWWEQHTARR